MQRWLVISMILLAAASAGAAKAAAPDAAELTRLLDEFLAGANGAAVHQWFWADDLIYTGSGGRRVGKADILRDMASAPAPSPQDPVTVYSAEDQRIQQYGSTALVAFRLVGTTTVAGVTRVARFLNSGMFVKRGGRWQAVGWQATRMPVPAEEARAQVVEAEAAFHRALSDADTAAAGAVLDAGFVWMDMNGERITRGRLLDDLASRRGLVERNGSERPSIEVHGEAAVVRGRLQYRPSISASGSSAGAASARPAPAILDYTLTFASAGGEWRAVALHTSRR